MEYKFMKKKKNYINPNKLSLPLLFKGTWSRLFGYVTINVYPHITVMYHYGRTSIFFFLVFLLKSSVKKISTLYFKFIFTFENT